ACGTHTFSLHDALPILGGVISLVTKSGTNSLRGSGFEFFRDSALDARNFFDRGTEPPPFSRNQFGASAGGPIRKNRLFFFAGVEDRKSTRLNSSHVSIS